MSKITEFLIKHHRLYYVAMVLKFGNNEKFRENVISLNENPKLVEIEKRGEKDRGILVYELNPIIQHAGFFAVFRRLLSGLYYAEEIGAQPYVYYSGDFLYAEDHPVNGKEDPFEYYFEPIKSIPEEDISQANSVIRFNPKHNRIAESLNGKRDVTYWVSEEYLSALAKVFEKYIQLNKAMNSYIQNGIEKMHITDRTIGVHCRGTDFDIGSKSHPIIVQVEDYFAIIDELLTNSEYDMIFLATDDANRLEKFKNKYENKLTYFTDVERAQGTEGVHFSAANRENHHYKLGAEVIRDVYMLANCGCLIAGMSEVSICARIAKRSTGRKFRKEVIIDKGIVLKGRRFEHK